MKLNNRFIFGILSLVLAAVIAFVALPTIARQTNGKTEIVRITQPVLKGEQVTKENAEVVEVKSSRHIAFIPLLIFMFTSGAVIFDADNKGTFIDESRGLAFSPSREEWTMIYKKPDEKFSHENITYTVGSRVLANEASEYSGLFGRILEIRTDDDRETENDTPDIYCEFDPPCLSAARRALEQTFSELYGAPKRMEDLGLELVIMAPEMLTPLAVPEQAYPQGTLYVVVSHWATDGEFGSYEAPFTNLMDAQRQFHDDLKNELESGCVEKWREKSQFAEEETAESYECYLDGEYCENHFYLSIEKRPLPLAPEFIRTVAAAYEDECAREDFLDKAQALPEYLALTEDQKKQLLHNADIKGRISHYLDLCDTYWECYWDAVSKAAQDILQEDQQASPQK